MSQDSDIRAWAREQGMDVADKGRLPGKVLDAWEAEQANGEAPVMLTPEPETTATATVTPPEAPKDTGERPPRPAPEKRRGIFQRPAKGKGKPPGKDLARTPRASTADLLSFLWGGIGYACARNPRMVPTARVMDMQAPYAGEMLDEILKGTFIDKLLQPLARGGKRAEMVFGLAGPPMIVTIITNRPEMMPVLRPALKMSLIMGMQHSEQARRKAAARMAKFTEEYGDDIADLDEMIESFFAVMDFPAQHSPAEDEAVRRARGDGHPS